MRRLADNVRRAVEGTGVERVWLAHMMVGVTMSEDSDWDEVSERVQNCMGVAKFFPATETSLDLDAVKDHIATELKDKSFKTFRISAHRSDKRFPIKSVKINEELGTFVLGMTDAKVQLKNPDLEIFLDVLPKGILVYFDEVRGYGGLPVGVSGRLMALLSGGIDSPVAAFNMMKRGSMAEFVHFHSHPLVDTSSIEKAEELVDMLTRHQYHSRLHLVPFGELQTQIIVSAPPAYRVVLYRRFMIRIAEALARRNRIKALLTGDSLAQVASQTLENISIIDDAATMPILRPLIGHNKDEIIDVAVKIGTFPVSILPDQDCCSLFVPKHPVTHGDLNMVERIEADFPVDEMVQKALDGAQLKEFSFPE